jgi:hypothetical protein
MEIPEEMHNIESLLGIDMSIFDDSEPYQQKQQRANCYGRRPEWKFNDNYDP